MPAKRTAAKKTTARKAAVKKTTAKKTTAKKTTAKRTSVKKAAAKKSTTKRPGSTPRGARRGDLIVIDSTQVGSPTREGEILRVIQGELGVSYRVLWTDGHETLISPKSGSARIVPASK